MSTSIRTAATIAAALALVSTLTAAHHSYTRAELEAMSKDRLINIILELQGDPDGGGDCRWFQPLAGERPRVMTRVNNPGFTNDGTLRWPNGKTFMLRNSGFTNDRTISYPKGQVMLQRNTGFTNDGTLYWPNGKVMVLANRGFTNDGTIYRADGSIWLRRNRGFSNDRQRYGLPVERTTDSNMTVGASLEDDDTLTAEVRVFGQGWSITARLESAHGSVGVQECLQR